MKAIVTGANGFVGSHLVEGLIRHGQQVVCLVRGGSDLRWLGGLPVEIVNIRRSGTARHCQAGTADVGQCPTYAPVEIVRDGLDSVDGLARVMAGADAGEGAEFVFHVAGLTRGRSAGEYMAANAETTRRLVEAATRCGGTIRRFVYVSSMAAAGPNRSEDPLDETCAPAPVDDYGRSKLAGERIVMEAGAGGLPVTIVRPPGVYGPRDTNFLPLFRAAGRWGVLPAIGGPLKQFTLVHAEDLAEGIWLAATNPAGVGQTYFLGSGTYTTAELAAAMSAAIGRPLRVLNVPKPLAILAGEFGQLKWALTGKPQVMSRRKVRDLLQPRWTCSWDKARSELGYRERTKLTDGLRQTALWYEAQGWMKVVRG